MGARKYNNIKIGDYIHNNQLAEVKIRYIGKTPNEERLLNSLQVFDVLIGLFNPDTIALTEDFFILLLNRANKCLGWFRVSSGGTSGVCVDVKIIMVLALKTNAHGIILCHNHPSGSLVPSSCDISITEHICVAAKLFDITVYDHIIVTPDKQYFSFADASMLKIPTK